MPNSIAPSCWRPQLIIFSFLTILGIAGNYFSFPLFFGVEIIFGSIASLLMIAAFGLKWGLASTLIISSYTYFVWNHPYAIIIFSLEGLFVGLTLKRFRSNLALAVGTYWVFIGIPLVYFFYRYFLGLDLPAVTLSALKQATNGIFNAIIAGLILSHTPILQLFGFQREKHISVFQNIFNLFVAAALIPALFIVLIDARTAVEQIEKSASAQIETISTGISLSIERWLTQQEKAIMATSQIATQVGISNRRQLQQAVENTHAIWSDYLGSFITDENGVTIAFEPLKNPKGESTIGISFSDRDYFKKLKEGAPSPYISNVFMARGGTFQPVFNIASAIYQNEQFVGIASGSINLEQVENILHYVPGKTGFLSTLVDRDGTVIVSDNPKYKSLLKYADVSEGTIEPTDANLFFRRPDVEHQNPMARWSQSNLGRTLTIPGTAGWQLIVEMPLAPLQNILYNNYNRSLAFILFLVIAILGVSILIASRISSPLSMLSRQTTNLPNRLTGLGQIQWPTSRLLEINVLMQNFKSTAEALKRKFLDLESSKEQLEKAKEDAEAANRLKSAFLANMSHEIRTPLGIMIGFADLISEENLEFSERKKFTETLKRNGEQLSVLINDILDLSKVEAGHLSVENIEFSLCELMSDVKSTFSVKANEKNINFEIVVPENISDRLSTDPVRLKQILWNLIGNAIKFTDSQGRVQVTVLKNDQNLEIDILDSGIGIDNDQQEKLFKPFSQLDESMTRRFGGTGLGLALSKRLSQLLSGDLTLKRSELGKGSIFSVQVKNNVYSEPGYDQNFQVSTVATAEKEDISGLRILIVEDAVENQFLIKRALVKKGVVVEVADNGSLGVDKALEIKPDMIIMDLQMPVMDGYSATEILRKSGFNKPIIALSAHAMNDIKDKCVEAGCTDYLSKPVNSEELISTIAKHLN